MIRYLIICLAFIFVKCQESESTEACRSPTFNIFTNDASSISAAPLQQTGNVLQGRPGKIGPRGFKGDKGIQGEPGIPDNSVVDPLRRKLTKLKNKFDEGKINLDAMVGLRRELDDVKNDLAVAKRRINRLRPQYFSSCAYIYGTSQNNGMYLINPNPNRLQSFYVYCNFSGNIPETIINHDSLNEVRFSECESPYCYKRKVNYTATLPQIVSLINASMNCRQFIKLRCIGVAFEQGRHVWISRNGNRELYWGGATSERDGYCACGETGTCDNRSKKCNCDSNDATERSDEGFLTNKNKLPVMELQFGDNDPNYNETGWHTLGPLICSGRS